MFKRLIIFMIVLSVFWGSNAMAWASALHAETHLVSQEQVFHLSENPLLAAVLANPDILADSDLNASFRAESLLWILSIFLPGFGQIVLGEELRGTVILISVLGLVFSAFPVALLGGGSAFSIPIPGYGLILALLMLVTAVGIWIWNIFDAFALNQKKNSHLTDKDLIQALTQLRLQLQVIDRFAQDNKLVFLQNGINIEHRIHQF